MQTKRNTISQMDKISQVAVCNSGDLNVSIFFFHAGSRRSLFTEFCRAPIDKARHSERCIIRNTDRCSDAIGCLEKNEKAWYGRLSRYTYVVWSIWHRGAKLFIG